jgi:hypothetical protein
MRHPTFFYLSVFSRRNPTHRIDIVLISVSAISESEEKHSLSKFRQRPIPYHKSIENVSFEDKEPKSQVHTAKSLSFSWRFRAMAYAMPPTLVNGQLWNTGKGMQRPGTNDDNVGHTERDEIGFWGRSWSWR